jgi:hypothetical protein
MEFYIRSNDLHVQIKRGGNYINMRKVIVEEEVVVRDGGSGDGAGSSAIWAVAMIIIVAMIAGAVYYSGILKKAPAKQKVDVEISVPR